MDEETLDISTEFEDEETLDITDDYVDWVMEYPTTDIVYLELTDYEYTHISFYGQNGGGDCEDDRPDTGMLYPRG